MLIAIVPIVVMLVGLLMWILASNPKISQVGYVLFCVGSFFTVSALAHITLRLG